MLRCTIGLLLDDTSEFVEHGGAINKSREVLDGIGGAEPASIGISPIGGFFEPTGHHNDNGVVALCNPDATLRVNVPISPGLHAEVGIDSVRPVAFAECVNFEGPGILAFDGDRSIKLADRDVATANVLRDGPFIIEAEKVMALAAANNRFQL